MNKKSLTAERPNCFVELFKPEAFDVSRCGVYGN